MSEWLTEEKRKFFKKKALYQKTGLSNAFKNKTMTLREIRLKVAYLKEVVNWTIEKQSNKQWKLEAEDMKDWVEKFERKIELEYKPNVSKPADKEKVWRFEKEAYEREMAKSFDEEEGEGKTLSTPKVATRGQRRHRSEVSTISSNFEEGEKTLVDDYEDQVKMAKGEKSSKMAAVEKGTKMESSHVTTNITESSGEMEEEADDYEWSDGINIDSKRDNLIKFDDEGASEFKAQLTRENQPSISVRKWLKDSVDPNETISAEKLQSVESDQ